MNHGSSTLQQRPSVPALMSAPAASTSVPAPLPPRSLTTHPSAALASNIVATSVSFTSSSDALINLVRGSGAHPLTHVATKVGVFDNNPLREEKNFLNAQLKIDPWQSFCVWRSQQQGFSSPAHDSNHFISVGQADGNVVTSKIGVGESYAFAPLNLTHTVTLSSNHRVASLISAPSQPFLAAVCDGCLFIMSTDPSRFNAAGPTVIARVKKCRQAIAFDDQFLYFLTEGKDKMNCLPLVRLSDKTATYLPEADGKISRLFDVAPITLSISCLYNDLSPGLHQLDITALSASCCILAIAHTKGFVVLDLKRNVSNVIHSAVHDGSSRSMITVMPGGIIAVANHPFHHSIDEVKKTKKDDEKLIFEDSIVFLQPPRSRTSIQSLDELLKKHQFYAVSYAGTGCTIKGMAPVGSFMFVLLGSKDVTANVTDQTQRKGIAGSAVQSCFLDICVPTSGLSLKHYRSHGPNWVSRLQELTFNMPCFHDYKLKWIASAGSMLACINGSACADISLLELNPALFQNIMDAHWFQEAKNQALPPLNVFNGSCEWDQLDTLMPMLKDHWWKALCFDIRRPQKFVQQRLLQLRSNPSLQIPQRDASYASTSCFRTISCNIWELVVRDDDSDEVSKQREMLFESTPGISLDSSSSLSASSPESFNPWSELVSDCSLMVSKSVDDSKSEFEKLDIAFGRSSPSLKRGVIKPANDEERVQKAREIMIAGMNKKDKMSLAMNDLASGPCARFFEMHICLRNISLSHTIGVDMLPLTMSCCLYAPNGNRLTPNYEVDRKPNDLSPFSGDCVFANITGSDTKNQQPPRYVIAVFRFYCHYRGDKSSPGKKYLEKEIVTDIKAERESIFKELSNLGHLLQPLAWSFVVIPLDAHDLKEFAWPEWVNPEEKECFLKQSTSKGMQHSDAPWFPEAERGFCSLVYRLNNRALTDDDVKALVAQDNSPRRERLTQSIFLSFTARKGHLALPSVSSTSPSTTIITSLPEDHNAGHQSVFLEGVLSNVRETPISCYRPCFDERHELFLLPQLLISSGLKKAHNLLLEVMVRSTDTKLEQDESILLTDLDDHKKEQMGFLKCIKGIRRLRDPPEFFDAITADRAEKSTPSSASAADPSASPTSKGSSESAGRSPCMMFSDLSPLIYHETECSLSSQIHILLPFIPPSKAAKLHVLFNVYHVSCWNTKKKQASKGQLQLIGRGYHPLLQFAPQSVSDRHDGLRIPLVMKLDPGYLDHHQKSPEGFFHREVNACVQLNCIWRSNVWPASTEISFFAWQSARIMSIIQIAEQTHGGLNSQSEQQSDAGKASELALSNQDTVDDQHEAPSVPSSSDKSGFGSDSPLDAEKSQLPPFIEGKSFLRSVSWLKDGADGENFALRLHAAVLLACELPRQESSVLLKFLPVWSQALFDLLPLVDMHQSKALFEALVSCIYSIKQASDLNHDFIQSIISDWVTWSVSTSHHHPVGVQPLYAVLLREFVRLLRPWLGQGLVSSYHSFTHSHTAALSVTDVVLSLISKLAASTGDAQPIGIESAWGHISRLSSSLGSLIASGDMLATFPSPNCEPSKEPPLRDLPLYLNVCSAFAEFLRGWFSLGQRGATAQACFAFCHELYRHENCEILIVYFWKRFCSDNKDTPFLFPCAYPDVPFPLFHWTGPVSRRVQRASVVGKHIGKAGVENTPIISVAFNLSSILLLRGSPNGTNLGLCIVNAVIAASCELTPSCPTATTIRSAASPLLERLLVATVPFIAYNHPKNSQHVITFFSLIARTLTCVSEADWEQYWLQEIDKGNISLSSSFRGDSPPSLSADGPRDPHTQPVPMSLFGWMKAMLIVAFKENPGLDSETGGKSSSANHDHTLVNVTSKFLNYSGKLDDEVKFSIALSISNGLHVLLTHLKTEAFLQRLDVSERKTHFFDLLLCDDSARITGISTDQIASKVSTLFEWTWSLLLHLHFVLVCSQNSFEHKSKFFELPSHVGPVMTMPDPLVNEAETVQIQRPETVPAQRRVSVTVKSHEAAANAKDILARHYTKQQGNMHVTHVKLDDSRIVKNVYIAIHDSMKLLLEQSVYCLFSSSLHTVLSSRYRNRVILQIFLEGTNMNQLYPFEFSSQESVALSRPLSAPSDFSSTSMSNMTTRSDVASLPAGVTYEIFVSDETQSLPSSFAGDLSHGSLLDTAALSSSVMSTRSDSSDRTVANEMLFSRGAPTRSSRFDSLAPLRASSARFSSLHSLAALRDQGNIRFLIDFLLMFIREDFNLNSSNLFATSFAFTSAVHDMYTVLSVNPKFRLSAAKTASIILKVATSELTVLNSIPTSRAGSVFDGYDDKIVQELSSAASSMFSVIESIATDAKVVWDTSQKLDLPDATYRMFQLTQRSAPSPYRRAFWLQKLSKLYEENKRPLEAAINLIELCVHANITAEKLSAASTGEKLPMPLLGDGLVFPFINVEALSMAFICPADGPVGRNAFLAAKDHKELFASEHILKHLNSAAVLLVEARQWHAAHMVYTLLMKHYMITRNSEQLSLVFAGFKNVYDQQISKPAYPMAFFYVKVHNPSPVQIVGDESSQQQTPIDEEFVYIDDGFVTIGAFLAKIKADFEKIIGSEVKVVQGESIPSSMTSQCVLCIHNLTPVEKVDPTWTVPEHSEFYYEQPYVDGGGAQTSDILKQRLRRFTYKTQSRLPGPLMRSPIITEATTIVLLSPAMKQCLGLRSQIEAIRASSGEADVKDPDIFKAAYFQKLMGTLIPGVNEGPRAVVLAFFKDVPRETRSDDLKELCEAVHDLCRVCRSTVSLFHRHAAMVPKEVQKSLEDMGYGEKLQAALELLEADVNSWC